MASSTHQVVSAVSGCGQDMVEYWRTNQVLPVLAKKTNKGIGKMSKGSCCLLCMIEARWTVG